MQSGGASMFSYTLHGVAPDPNALSPRRQPAGAADTDDLVLPLRPLYLPSLASLVRAAGAVLFGAALGSAFGALREPSARAALMAWVTPGHEAAWHHAA